MFLLIGYVIILLSSVGTYAIHGNVAALWVPTEYAAIIGLGIGGLVAGNGSRAIKHTLKALPGILKGSKHNKAYYMDALCLMYELLSKVRKEGLMSIEQDVENPGSSPFFSKYPNIVNDHHLVEFITDYLRMMVGGNLNTMEIEGLMDQELEVHHHELHAPSHIMQTTADGLPAFGIVVCVMGVVNTMGSVGEPPAVLGKMIAGALVGTFLGILVSYGFVAPIASQLGQIAEHEGRIFTCIKAVLLASMNGYAPQVAVEFGRKVLEGDDRPTFQELEAELKNHK